MIAAQHLRAAQPRGAGGGDQHGRVDLEKSLRFSIYVGGGQQGRDSRDPAFLRLAQQQAAGFAGASRAAKASSCA